MAKRGSISRVLHRGRPYWRFTFQDRRVGVYINKTFYDHRYGSIESALDAVTQYQEEFLLTHPELLSSHHLKCTSRNTTGVVGVFKCDENNYIAGVKKDGKHVSVHFKHNRYGDKTFSIASEFRSKWERYVNLGKEDEFWEEEG